VDPFVIECGTTIYGRHCTEDDKDYIPIVVPAWTKMKLRFWDSLCEENPTEHVRFEFYPGNDESPSGCGNDTYVYFRNYVWIINNDCDPWHLLVEVQGRPDHDDNDPTRYKIVTEECVELDDNPCTEIPCTAPSPVSLPWTGQPFCECLNICEGQVVTVCVGPLNPNNLPYLWYVTAGCSPQNTFCENDCDPASPFIVEGWYYSPDHGTWCLDVGSNSDGCFCFCLDDILSVELLDFTAIPGNGQIELNWSTASEVSNSHFDILRDGHVVGRVNSTGNASGSNYSWTDNLLQNGVNYTYTLVSVDLSGTRDEVGTVTATPNFAAGTLTDYALHQNYPNPFNPETSISFDLPEAGFASLKIYNAIGQVVATLVESEQSEGRHIVNFNASSLPTGLYFYRLESGSFVAQKKMLFIK
jgi:hypothetical protein